MRRSLLVTIILVVLLAGMALLSAQPTMTIQEDNLLALIKSNVPEKIIVKALSEAGKIEVDTSIENLPRLMEKGVTGAVLTALVERKEQLTTSRPTTPAAVSPQVSAEETGIFVETANGLASLRSEPVKVKGSSSLKFMATGGFGKLSTKGLLDGPKSQLQLSGPVIIVIRLAPGEKPEDFQLVPLEGKKGQREFVTSETSLLRGIKGSGNSFAGPGSGTAIAGSELQFQKMAPGTYRASLELDSGEYGVMALKESQRLYTFGVK